MVDKNRSRDRASAWPDQAAGRRPGLAWTPEWRRGFSAMYGAFSACLQAWAVADVGPGRLLPWIPVAFGCGIAVYFSTDREPALWAAGGLALACAAISAAARRRAVGFAMALAVTATVAGYATATWRTSRMAHPVLSHALSGVTIQGFVEIRELRERSDRIVIAVEGIEAAGLTDTLQRVRVAVRKGTAPAVGTFISLKTRLNPPLAPLRPGGYDFARDLYFQDIGAIGFALGKITIIQPPVRAGWRVRYAALIDGMRRTVDDRIREVIPGDKGAIASALLTGTRDAISAPVNDAMYISSLAHVLSISGYHMAVIAGVVFFVIRAMLALVPTIRNP